MVLRARLFDAAEAQAAGFVAEVCEATALDEKVAGVTERLLGNAPLTMWAAKVAVARIRRANLPSDDDFVARIYASEDFRRGVTVFRAGSSVDRPRWSGT
jgi:enoyl-CoA hydratase/carnithine racemase